MEFHGFVGANHTVLWGEAVFPVAPSLCYTELNHRVTGPIYDPKHYVPIKGDVMETQVRHAPTDAGQTCGKRDVGDTRSIYVNPCRCMATLNHFDGEHNHNPNPTPTPTPTPRILATLMENTTGSAPVFSSSIVSRSPTKTTGKKSPKNKKPNSIKIK